MGISTFNHVKISGIKAVVPEHFINIDDEIEFFNNDLKLLERNKKILGLGKRHVADDRTTNSDLLEQAARLLIEEINVDKDSIDALIVVSTSHDYHYPASACVIQGRLDLNENCTCMDLSGLACSGYVHGLLTAHSLIESGAFKKVLLLAGDITSTHSDRRNRNSNMLFGDAGTATLLEYTDSNQSYFLTGTDGKGWNKLIAPAGGYALPMRADIAGLEITDESGNVWRMCDDIMKGLDIFKFATQVGPKGIQDLLDYAHLTQDDIDYFAFHQANKQIIRSIAMYAGISKSKWSAQTFSEYGNCGTAAVTMDICRELSQENKQKILLATFGVGLSWGFAILNTKDTYVGQIELYKTPDSKLNREQTIKYWIDYFKSGNNA